MIAFDFLPQNAGWWKGPMNDILSVCEYSLSSWYNRCWRHLNLNCCNQFHLNFLHSEVVGMLKHEQPCEISLPIYMYHVTSQHTKRLQPGILTSLRCTVRYFAKLLIH